MYSVVLATMLTAGGATPAWHHYHSYYGCYSCYSCYGCYGYGGYAAYPGFYTRPYWAGYYGAYGCYGCSGCYGCTVYAYSGCSYYGCSVCCGGAVYSSGPTVVPVPSTPSSSPGAFTPSEVDALRRLLQNPAPQRSSHRRRMEEGSAPVAKPSRVTVVLPADARLWVDNVECPMTSAVRSFNTPAMPSNQKYFYDLKMEVVREGRTISETRRAVITPGQPVQVDFNAGAISTAAR